MNEYIEYEQVVNSAKELRNCANKMQSIFDEITGNMQNMTSEDRFSGIASTRLQEEFNKKKSEFDDYVSAVNRFAALFETSSQMIEDSEKRMASVADQLNV